LAQVLLEQPRLAGTLELAWRHARSSFPGLKITEWLDACRDLAAGEVGVDGAIIYLRNALACAAVVGPDAALALADAAPRLAVSAGRHAALTLLAAAPDAARRLKDGQSFTEWLRVVGQVAERAPESVGLLLEHSADMLAEFDVRMFEAWALSGIRDAEGVAEKRLKVFALLDRGPQRRLVHEADEIFFADIDRQLKAFLMALWRRAQPIRTINDLNFDRPRRASFAGRIIRVPKSFRGFAGRQATDVFYAALAHIAAHLQFSQQRFPVGSLKPVQVALTSLIEDARVEHLAMRIYPGLRKLWLPFHVAQPSGALAAPLLMTRLARALIDPGYEDDNGWVQKGRELFVADPDGWSNPAMSRRIGGLLGNDLGQMRAQFNAKTYAVEPAYRDDNQGLWDFGDAGGSPEEQDTILESVRFDQVDDTSRPDRERDTQDDSDADGSNHATLVEARKEIGVPTARYPEWDYLIGQDRPEWTTLAEYVAAPGRAQRIDESLERHSQLVYRITTLIRSAKVSRPLRLRRQPDGDRLDLEACIDAAINRRLRVAPDPKVYAKLERRFRDLSVLLLLDASQSTNDIARGINTSVLELEREAAALLAHAMAGLGDPFALHAFCSDTRADVHYYRIKDFDAPYDASAKARLAGLKGRFSTRMGAALRHAGRELAGQMSYRRLLLMISDGEPSDVDVADRQYLVEDARRAVMSLTHLGVDVFCVGLDAGGDNYLTRIFGRRNVLQVDRVERLPEKLPMLYFRLTS
jgi:nitric oxide reductase NorD protein